MLHRDNGQLTPSSYVVFGTVAAGAAPWASDSLRHTESIVGWWKIEGSGVRRGVRG